MPLTFHVLRRTSEPHSPQPQAGGMEFAARMENLEHIAKVPFLLSLLIVVLKSADTDNRPAPLPATKCELYRLAIEVWRMRACRERRSRARVSGLAQGWVGLKASW